VLERTLSLRDQSHVWTIGYAALIALTVACAAALWRSTDGVGARADRAAPIPWDRRARWVVLAFVPSSLMLGVTAQITSQIAPIPLFWVIGLALYLLTLIVAFARRDPMPSRWLVRVLPLLVLAVVFFAFLRPTYSPWILVLDLATFVVAAYICHGQLAADRPGTRHLTDFYLWLSVGGALGGVFNGLIAPLVFSRLAEYPLALFLACFMRPEWLRPGRFTSRPRGLALLAFVSLVLAALVTTAGQANVLLADRSFYGVYTVKSLDISGGRYHALVDGNTLHGLQSLDPGRAGLPLLYFYRGAPISQAFGALRRRHPVARIGVVGLGAGSLGCYARPGDRWTFFELDPDIDRIAHDAKLFTLLPRCDPHARVVLGDGRLNVAAEPDHSFELLVLDAFNSERARTPADARGGRDLRAQADLRRAARLQRDEPLPRPAHRAREPGRERRADGVRARRPECGSPRRPRALALGRARADVARPRARLAPAAARPFEAALDRPVLERAQRAALAPVNGACPLWCKSPVRRTLTACQRPAPG
jgi:hypothetical protein